MQVESTDTPDAAGVNRRSLLRTAASVGAVAAVGTVWRTSANGSANAQGDLRVELLNLGLQSEYLVCSSYQEALEYEALNERDREVVGAMLDETVSVIERFRAAVEEFGGQPLEKTGMTFPEHAEGDREACLTVLLEIQNLTMQGWHGAAPMVTDPAVVTLAQQLGLTKSRQAGAISFLLGEAANAFPWTMVTGRPLAEVLQELQPYRGAE